MEQESPNIFSMLSKTNMDKATRDHLLKVKKQQAAENNWNANFPAKSSHSIVELSFHVHLPAVWFPESERGCAAEVFFPLNFKKQKLRAKQGRDRKLQTDLWVFLCNRLRLGGPRDVGVGRWKRSLAWVHSGFWASTAVKIVHGCLADS